MGPIFWLVVHLTAASALAGVGWVVQLVVYPAFRLVGPDAWVPYHRAHTQAITRVVAVPWLLQGVSTAALLLSSGDRLVAAVLAVLALVTVVSTVLTAVPAHGRLAAAAGSADVTVLLRANLVRTLAWTGSTVLAAVSLL